jgi:hypothetical protein
MDVFANSSAISRIALNTLFVNNSIIINYVDDGWSIGKVKPRKKWTDRVLRHSSAAKMVKPVSFLDAELRFLWFYGWRFCSHARFCVHLRLLMLHAHDAIRAAHYSRAGNYLGANECSYGCAKALCFAKDSFSRSDVSNGRMTVHIASQQLGVVAAARARARLADPSADIYRHFALRKCVVEESAPLCKMAGHC